VHLKCIIDSCESDEILLRDSCAEADFIHAAIHSAMYSNPSAQSKVLNDISLILGCQAEDLEFLFYPETQTDKFNGSLYGVDLPDYRSDDNLDILEAAE